MQDKNKQFVISNSLPAEKRHRLPNMDKSNYKTNDAKTRCFSDQRQPEFKTSYGESPMSGFQVQKFVHPTTSNGYEITGNMPSLMPDAADEPEDDSWKKHISAHDPLGLMSESVHNSMKRGTSKPRYNDRISQQNLLPIVKKARSIFSPNYSARHEIFF